MQAQQQYKILALMLCCHLIQAKIDLYGSANINESYLNIRHKLKLTPERSLPLPEQNIIVSIPSGHVELQGTWNFDDEKGIIGGVEFGLTQEDAQLTAMGSYETSISNLFAASIGGFYQTQSGSELSASVRVIAPEIQITSKADGLLFNGHTPAEPHQFRPLSVQIMAKIALPVSSSFDAYLSGGYGITSFKTELPFNPDADACTNFALVEQDANELAIGNQMSRSPSILFNHINFGFRAHIYTQN
jgi:hypothetical protein